MLRWLEGLRFNPRLTIIAVAFTSYIYDAIRNEYIESRKHSYQQYLKAKREIGTNPESALEPAWLLQNIPILSDILDNDEPVGLSERGEDAMVPFLCDPPAVRSSVVITIEVPISGHRVSATEEQVDTEPTGDPDDVELAEDMFACPLPAMPKYIRSYQVISTTFHVYVAVKYLFITLVQFKWINLDPAYLCYLPGRLTYVGDISYEFPPFLFLVGTLHLIYRSLWYFIADRLDLDCFQFLCLDEQFVMDKQNKLAHLNEPGVAPIISYKMYLCGKIFYQRYKTIDRKIRYKMRPNRTLEQWRKLRNAANAIPLIYYSCLALVFMPILIISLYNYFSPGAFEQSYPHCEFLSGRIADESFEWYFTDSYKRIAFVCDILEASIFLPDVTFALVLPAAGAILLSYDLASHFDQIISNLSDLIDKINVVHDIRSQKGAKSRHVDLPKLKSIIKEEANIFYVDVIYVFQHVCKVDRFIRVFAPFCIFVWFVINLSYQALSIFRKQILISNATFQYVQIFSCIMLTIMFSMLVRPHNRSQVLYEKLCAAIAVDFDHQTTRGFWSRLLGFYHRNQSKFTLHILSTSYPLSRINYLRIVSWFITCTLILLNLMRYKLDQWQN